MIVSEPAAGSRQPAAASTQSCRARRAAYGRVPPESCRDDRNAADPLRSSALPISSPNSGRSFGSTTVALPDREHLASSLQTQNRA